MAILKKTLFPENLEKFSVYVDDTIDTSKYFKITELPDTFTGGKNSFLIQGSEQLVSDTIIKIEIKDAQGNVVYHEPGSGIPEYYEGTSKVVAVYVYPDTAFGPCTITILGELKEYYDANGFITEIPLNWQGQYNVKWQKQININPAAANTSKIRFYRRPKVSITESVLSVYNRTVSKKTISGSVSGVAISPIDGNDYKSFKGILQYQLEMGSGSYFSQSMENVTMSIDVDGKNYIPTIVDVTTDKKAFVNVPYYITSSASPNYQSVTNFSNKNFVLTYEESEILTNSNVSSSFATIKLTDLESFTGDPARVKVFASSRHDLGDYQLLEDIQLESNEIFLAREFDNQLNVRTGIFSDLVLNNFWVSQSMEANPITSVDNSLLMKSVKLQPDNDFSSSVGLFCFHYKTLLQFTKNTEYQLDFTPLLSSSVSGYGGLEIYLSGSAFANMHNSFGKEIYNEETTAPFRKYEKQQVNFKPDMDGTGQVKFVVNGGTWQLSNISLRASHESSFAPNEIELIADIPTKINNETFDFKFELYDINNNYVPVVIEQTHTFVGGNDIRIKRDLNVTNEVSQFNFATASAFPSSILIDWSTTGLTGSVTFTSQAVDSTGLGITDSDVTIGSNYPGLLSYVDVDTKELSIEAFTSSLEGGKIVGAITYTASCEDINRYFTIYRVDQGAPSYLFYATADKNNFTFDPDDNYKSVVTDDYIDIRLVKQNLPSIAPIGLTITSASETGVPVPLNEITTIGNATIYRLYTTSSTHNSSIDGYSFGIGQSHYDFDLDTVDGHFTSSITIDAIEKGDKAKGLIATSDRNQFFYKMTDKSPLPTSQTATILVKRQNLGSITNTITVTSGSKPPLTYTGTTNGVATYTVSAGQSTNYQYDSATTKYVFSASDLNGVTYSDEISLSTIIAEAQISVNLSNDNTTLPAYSTGFVPSGSFVLTIGSISVKVGGEDISRNENLTTNNRWDIISATAVGCVANDTTPDDEKYSITRLDADSGSLSLLVRYKDGRGVSTDVTKVVTYSKAKAGVPNIIVAVSPTSQTLVSNSKGSGSALPTTLTITALEGGISKFTSIGTPTYTGGLAGSVSSNTITFTSNASTMYSDTGNVTIPINYTDSENISGTKTVVATISKSKAAAPTTLAILSSETQTVLSSSAGFATPTAFTITLTEGGSSYTYDAGLSTNNTFYVSVSGGSGTTSITPTTPSSVSGTTTTISIFYKNSEGTTGTLSKTHKVAVSLEGVKGTDGSIGADGKRTATGMVHYQLTSATAPSSPTATSYNLTTGVFTGLTTNWLTGAPTYASGNTNKYWYVTYTAVETTAGGGTGTPSFGSSTQAIGFSGLVSFTAADNVTDGSNTLSFGIAGATLINGSNISTGKIISTNYVAGTPYTNAGSIIDLDNGRIATKTFYIDSNGDAVFKGTLSAPTGNIGGWSIGTNNLSANSGQTILASDGTIKLKDVYGVTKVSLNYDTTNTTDPLNATAGTISFTGISAGTATFYNGVLSGQGVNGYLQGPGSAPDYFYAPTWNAGTNFTVPLTATYEFTLKFPVSTSLYANKTSGTGSPIVQLRLYIYRNSDSQNMNPRGYVSIPDEPPAGTPVGTAYNVYNTNNVFYLSGISLVAGVSYSFGVQYIVNNCNYGDYISIGYYLPNITVNYFAAVASSNMNQSGINLGQDTDRYIFTKPGTLDFYAGRVSALARATIGEQAGSMLLLNSDLYGYFNDWQRLYINNASYPRSNRSSGGNFITSHFYGGYNRSFLNLRAYAMFEPDSSTGFEVYASPWWPYSLNIDKVTYVSGNTFTVTFVEPLYGTESFPENGGGSFYSVVLANEGATGTMGGGMSIIAATNKTAYGFTLILNDTDSSGGRVAILVYK